MSLCIGFGCRATPLEGRPTCLAHIGLTPEAPSCPDGHGPLAFVVVSAVRLGGELSLLYACPSCDYVRQVDHPATPVLSP